MVLYTRLQPIAGRYRMGDYPRCGAGAVYEMIAERLAVAGTPVTGKCKLLTMQKPLNLAPVPHNVYNGMFRHLLDVI